MAVSDDLRRRVTGAAGKPPPAAGQVKSAGPRLPPAVLAEFKRLGWQDGDPIPPGIAERLAAHREAHSGDPTPDEFRTWLYSQPERSPTANMPPSVAAAYQQAATAAAGQSFAEVVDDFAEPAPSFVTMSDAEPEKPAEKADAKPAAINTERTVCPHCYFDLRSETIQPSELDKNNYVQARLGRIPFQKEYRLLGDRLAVRFRSLRRREHDILFSYAASVTRTATSPADLAVIQQRLERLTLMAQIVSYRSSVIEFHYPEALDKASAPRHEGPTWADRLKTPPEGAAEEQAAYIKRLCDLIDISLTDDILDEASSVRVLMDCVHQFNRLTSRMEYMETNEDFWQPTASQSA